LLNAGLDGTDVNFVASNEDDVISFRTMFLLFVSSDSYALRDTGIFDRDTLDLDAEVENDEPTFELGTDEVGLACHE
jgi:hypothetical protein